MKRKRKRRVFGAVAIALACVALLAAWQWQALGRMAVVAGVEALLHVRVSFRHATLAPDRAAFADIRITSFRNEPIAEIARLSLAYDVRELLPGGDRFFGLKAVELDSPHLTVIRRPDGTYNVPISSVPAKNGRQGPPVVLRGRLRNGSVEIVDESATALPSQRHLYLEGVQADADIATGSRSTYAVDLRYGERRDRLYPVRGRGEIDPKNGYIDQRWTARTLPISGAVNFVLNSPALRLQSGTLEDVDARYFGIAGVRGSVEAHLAAGGLLTEGSVTIAGLSKPVEHVRGRVDVYDDGLLTPRLEASLAGVPASISGGIYGVQDPRVRMAVRGSGDLARLRSAFAQAQRLPMHGPVTFELLAEGSATKPVTWIELSSPQTTYAGTSFDHVSGVLAFDGREADIVGFNAKYGRVQLAARGRLRLNTQHNSLEMLVGAKSPPNGTPYVSALLPQIPLNVAALATADDPKAIGLRGALWGSGGPQRLDAIFNVDSSGSGSVGPLRASDGRGSLYARIALDRARGSSFGLVAARDFPLTPARGALNATLFGTQGAGRIDVGGSARLAGTWGSAVARGRVALQHGALRGALFGNVGNAASFAAMVNGTPRTPGIAGTVVVAGGRYRDFNVNGNAGWALDNGTLHVHDAAVAIGPLFVGVTGTIAGLSPHGAFAPQYDLAAQLDSSDVNSLVATVQPRTAAVVQGSLDADLRVRGSGATPSFAGTVNAPEGSVNGLSFRDLRGAVRGDSTAISFNDARVIVGSSAIALSAAATPVSADVAVNASNLDLADLNDFFDTGDTFAGTGSLGVRARLSGQRLVGTSGEAHFSGARFRRVELGTVAARWRSTGGSVVSALRFGGPEGVVAINGSIAPASRQVDMNAESRDVDLGTWLPMLGFELPITGRLGAQANISGTYPDIAMQLHAAIYGGTVGRVPLERFEVTAASLHGRGSIQSAVLDVPSLATQASGTFGLRPGDPLALTVSSTSPNLGDFLQRITGKTFPVSGSFDSVLHVEGTRERPRLRDAIAFQALQYRTLTIPRVAAEIDADPRAITARNGEIDLVRGKALFSASAPIRLSRSGVVPGSGPISAWFAANDVELSNFAELLPKGTQIAGRLDGRLSAGGTLRAPDLSGSLALRDGIFNGPMEKSPITGIAGHVALHGSQAQLQSHAFVGGGAVTATAVASLANLSRPADATFTVEGRAENARLDLPAYFQGNLNGNLTMVRRAASAATLAGDVSVYNARIPLSAFLTAKGAGDSHSSLPNVVFDGLRIAAGPNVRVQSANVDIGAAGAVRLGGTLEAPTLAGTFSSTGGSLSFYRTFNLAQGNVTFDPSGGLVPDVDAVATSFVADPPTAISLHVTGAATNMNLALASDPPYSQQQILGLLVGAQQFGAVQGVRATGQSASAGSAGESLALGQLNTAFTRNLLEPLSASLGDALGFTEVGITSDIQAGLGLNAVKAFGKYVNAIWAQSFGYPQTQSIALEAHPDAGTGLRLAAYSSSGPTLFALQQPQPIGLDALNLNPLTAFTPVTSSNGVSFSYQRKFP